MALYYSGPDGRCLRAILQPASTSTLKTADAAIKAAPGVLLGVVVLTDGTNDATLTIYDNASAASGDELFKAIVPAADRTLVARLGVRATNGIYADISGTGAAYIVYYL